MQRAYWSADFAEAHIVEAMLRAHGVQAWVFDALLVRQDWFRTLMFGGYRVMVPDGDASRAAELLDGYRTGRLAVPEEAVERPACPRCAMPGSDDPAPHRFVFMLLIAAYALITTGLMVLQWSDAPSMLVASLVCFSFVPFVAITLARWLKGRYFCTQCGAHWRTRSMPFSVMAREADAAALRDAKP
jgi:hypothetical protein